MVIWRVGVDNEGNMIDHERLRLYIELSSAAWTVLEARHKYGPNSTEYQEAEVRCETARQAFRAYVNSPEYLREREHGKQLSLW